MDAPGRDNRMSLRLALRPILWAFRFDGRSTRTEVVAYYLLSMVMNLFSFHWGQDGSTWNLALRLLAGGWAIIWCWPWLPLLIRRLHDRSRSGWWSLVSLALIPFGLILALAPGLDGHSTMSVTMPFAGTRHLSGSPLNIALFLIVAIASLATAALYLWAPTRSENRYGPDPRIEPVLVSSA